MCLKSHLHSVTKAATYISIGAAEIFTVALFVTHDLAATSGILGTYLLTKPCVYYIHERVWHLPFFIRVFGQH